MKKIVNYVLLDLQVVQSSPAFRLKDTFHEKIMVIYIWTSSDIHSTQMLTKIISIDKHHSAAGVSEFVRHLSRTNYSFNFRSQYSVFIRRNMNMKNIE